MNVLLDTQVALWAITDSPRLPASAKTLIQAERTTVWISVVSLWELAIKHSLARGDMPISGQAAFDYFQQSGFRFMLIAQALTEPLRLVTHDQTVARYSEHILFV